MEQQRRKAGIDVLGDVRWGTHLCLFYDTANDLIDILVPYFAAGLENNEFCMWITSEPLQVEEAKSALNKEVLNLDDYIRKGQIEILDYTGWYTRSGKFNSDEVLQGWVEKEKAALEKGFDGLRLTGNMSWLERGDWGDFMRYEGEVDEAIRSHRMIAICAYPLDKCSMVDILDAASNHRAALISREGKCSIIRNLEGDRLQMVLESQMENFRNSLDESPLGVRIVAKDGELLYANKAILDMYGYSTFKELKSTPAKERYTPESYAEHRERARKRQQGEFVPSTYEIGIVRKDGEVRHLQVFRKEMVWNGEKQFQALYEDITERRRAEEVLQESEKFRSSLLSNSPNPIIVINPDTSIRYVNPALQQLTGFSFGEIVGKKPPYPWWRREKPTQEAIATLMQELRGEGKSREMLNKKKNGEEFWVDINVTPVAINGEFTYAVANWVDITERKQAEEALKASEEKYRTLLENLPVGVALVTYDGHSLERNKAIMEMHGYTSKDEFNKILASDLYFDPEERKRLLESVARGPVKNFETKHKRKDGSPFWISISVISGVGDGGEKQLIVISQDIDERKRAEEALRASEEKFRNLVENAPVGIAVRTTDGRSFERNKAFQEMHGYDSREELMKVSADGFYCDVEDRKRFLELATRGPVRDFEVRRKRKDGSCFWVSQSTIPFVTESGEHQLIAVVQDIDEKKKAEEEIQLKAHLLDSAGDMIYLHDLTGKIIYANDAVCKSHGYTRDEVMQMNIRNLLTPERAEMVSPIAQETLEKGDVKFETQHVCKNGSLVPVEVYNRLIKLGDGYAIIGVGRDITERKKAENELKVSEEKFRSLLENAPIGITISTTDGRRLEANKALIQMLGFGSKEELLEAPVADTYYDPEERKYYMALVEKGPVQNYEVRRKRKDGSVFWASLSSITYIDSSGEKLLISVIADISERKRAEEALRASEEKYRTMVENLPVGVAVSNVEGRSPERNRAFMEMHGYTSREEFDKIPAVELYFNPEDRKRFLSKLEKGAVRNFEIRHKRKDGSPFWISLSAIPQIGERGEKQILVISQDIDERKQAEEALKVSEEKFRSLLENAPVGIAVSTPEGRRLEANKALMQMQGFGSREELLAAPVADTYYDPEERKLFMSLLEKGPVQNYEVRRKRKDGSVFWASLNSITYVDSSGEKLLINVIADISERKQAEEALKASEERYRSLVEELPIGISVITMDGRAIQRNKALMEIYGCKTREELYAVTLPSLYYDQEDRQRFLELSAKRPVRNFETRFKRKDGTVFWVSINSIMQTALSGETVHVNVIQDIDEKKRAEEENRLKARMLDAVGDMIYLQDLTGKITYANDAACKSHGYTKDEVLQMNVRDLLTPEQAEMVQPRTDQALKKGKVKFETTHVCKDGSLIPLEIHNSLTNLDGDSAIISIGRDITERKKAEEQLLVTSRLASIGELASGVAHEINNPLTSVIGFSELLLEGPLPVDIKGDLTTIRDEAERASRVVKNLLTFARKHPVSKEPVDVNSIIEKVLELRVYEQTVNNIRVVLRLAPDLPKINADYYQLQQVFFNLIVNAEYFMSEAHNKGTLTITTEDLDDAVGISFADDGPGISAESLQHLFNPFFTTKPVGKGTGLGLSICHGIITDHNGKIYAESTYGKGATFFVEIPFTR